MKKVKPSSKEIKDLLKQAKERIESAETLLKIGNNRDAMSRAYYAFFDAASAVLLTKGEVAKTHHGLIILFDKYFVKTKELPIEMSRWLVRAKQAREEADYEREKEISKQSIESAIKTAKEFIANIEELIKLNNKQ